MNFVLLFGRQFIQVTQVPPSSPVIQGSPASREAPFIICKQYS